ncbi:hypothetical protein BH09PSE2_BH09PSE2_08260 [soil metagenome]
MFIVAAPPPAVQSASLSFAAPPRSALAATGFATPQPAPVLVKVAAPQTVVSSSATVTKAPAQVASAAVQTPPVDASSDAALPAATRPLPNPAGLSPMTLLKQTLSSSSSLIAEDPSATQPAVGLWVLATSSCILPAGTDLNGWADCTQPLGFNGGELAVLEKPKAGNKALATGGLFSIARTRYRMGAAPAVTPVKGAPAVPAFLAAAGAPALVQVEVPGLTGKSYVFIAVRPEITDAEGRFVSARAWPVACPAPATPGVSRRGDRCFASTLAAVRDAASAAPADGGYILRWIDPTDAGSAGDTTGARTYAAPPPVVFKAPKKLSPLEAAEPLPITDLPPELAAQQPQLPQYATRDEGSKDEAPATKAAPTAKATPAKAAVKAKKKS